MDRRDFARASAAAIGLASAPRFAAQPGAQAPRIVVDGLDTSIVNEGFLELVATGGVDCVHKSLDNTATYAAIYAFLHTCLLYTSDAADERSSVDLGGRRIIKK